MTIRPRSRSRTLRVAAFPAAPLAAAAPALPDGELDDSFYTDGRYAQPYLAPGFDQEFRAVAEAGRRGATVSRGAAASARSTASFSLPVSGASW